MRHSKRKETPDRQKKYGSQTCSQRTKRKINKYENACKSGNNCGVKCQGTALSQSFTNTCTTLQIDGTPNQKNKLCTICDVIYIHSSQKTNCFISKVGHSASCFQLPLDGAGSNRPAPDFRPYVSLLAADVSRDVLPPTCANFGKHQDCSNAKLVLPKYAGKQRSSNVTEVVKTPVTGRLFGQLYKTTQQVILGQYLKSKQRAAEKQECV